MQRCVMVLIAAAMLAACGKNPDKATETPKPVATAPAQTPATAPAPGPEATKAESASPPATPASAPPDSKQEGIKY